MSHWSSANNSQIRVMRGTSTAFPAFIDWPKAQLSLLHEILPRAEFNTHDMFLCADPLSTWKPQGQGSWFKSFKSTTLVGAELATLSAFLMNKPDPAAVLVAVAQSRPISSDLIKLAEIQSLFFPLNSEDFSWLIPKKIETKPFANAVVQKRPGEFMVLEPEETSYKAFQRSLDLDFLLSARSDKAVRLESGAGLAAFLVAPEKAGTIQSSFKRMTFRGSPRKLDAADAIVCEALEWARALLPPLQTISVNLTAPILGLFKPFKLAIERHSYATLGSLSDLYLGYSPILSYVSLLSHSDSPALLIDLTAFPDLDVVAVWRAP